MNIQLDRIFPNPDQPRKHFDNEKLGELAESIRQHGLMEPLVLVERAGGFMIVVGERRYRASKMAGLEEVPVRVIEADDHKVTELAIVENLEREDLNLIEEAQGYKQLMDMGLTLDQVAERMAKHPWRIQERLNLLKLDTIYQDCLIKNLITPSQAQEMSRLDSDGQRFLFEKINAGQASTYNKLRALANAILYKCEN